MSRSLRVRNTQSARLLQRREKEEGSNSYEIDNYKKKEERVVEGSRGKKWASVADGGGQMK